MKLTKVALLEDDKLFLKEMKDNLNQIGIVDVIIAEQCSNPFIEKVRELQPEILLLDIMLNGDSRNGIEVAQILKRPVIFISGARKEFLDSIDHLKTSKNFPPVENIGKIPDAEKLEVVLKKFLPIVREYQKNQKVKVKPVGDYEIVISTSDVSFILAQNKNHIIYFFNRKPITIADKSFKYFSENGFPSDNFYRYSRNYLLNIDATRYEDSILVANYISDSGEYKTEKIEVSDEKRKEVSIQFLK